MNEINDFNVSLKLRTSKSEFESSWDPKLNFLLAERLNTLTPGILWKSLSFWVSSLAVALPRIQFQQLYILIIFHSSLLPPSQPPVTWPNVSVAWYKRLSSILFLYEPVLLSTPHYHCINLNLTFFCLDYCISHLTISPCSKSLNFLIHLLYGYWDIFFP